MASMITHLVIGERVFPELQCFDPADYGPFLLGCILVDVHFSCAFDRRSTHFADRLQIDGAHSFDKSCVNFVRQLPGLLTRPWDELTTAQRAFIAGYLCHLAADEDWKRFDWKTLHALGVRWWVDLDVPVSVILTAFDVASTELYRDRAAVASALGAASVPAVVTHIPHKVLHTMWDAVREHAMDGSTAGSYLKMLERLGRSNGEVQIARHQHEVYWEDAIELIHSFFGGAESRIDAMVQRAMARMPLLYP